MENRGFLIAVVLILGIAMFAGSFNYGITGQTLTIGGPWSGGPTITPGGGGGCGCIIPDANDPCPTSGICSLSDCTKTWFTYPGGHKVLNTQTSKCYEEKTKDDDENEVPHACGPCIPDSPLPYPGSRWTSSGCPPEALECNSISCTFTNVFGDSTLWYPGHCSVAS